MRFAASVCSLVALAILMVYGAPHTLRGGEKVRFYEMGESDPGAMLGADAITTMDIQLPPTMDADGAPVMDSAGDFVPLMADPIEEPSYVEGRDGPGSFALDFDGVFDRLFSPAFDPRNFGTFASLSQAWIRPDSAKAGMRQAVWSLGSDNGGVGITAGEDGGPPKWELIGSNGIADTPSIANVAFDEWTHVAIFRGGNSASLYVNGQVAGQGAATWGGVGQVTVGLRTSENPITSQMQFDGAIDNFAITGFSDFAFNVFDDLDYFADIGALPPSGVAGDVDQDGDVDMDDYNIWSDNVGYNNGFGFSDPGTLRLGDVDNNGRINYFDLQQIIEGAAAMGTPLALAVPEPGAAAIALISALAAGLVAVKRRRRRLLMLASLAVCLLGLWTTATHAEVIVAEDFLYVQPTKVIGPGGGFTLQDYAGGQNGPVGQWDGEWTSIGNGIITSTDHMVVEEQFQAFITPGINPANLNRDYLLSGLADDQTLYFGIRMRTANPDQITDARFNVNPGPDDIGSPQVGLGFLDGSFDARLGDFTMVGLTLANDALYHQLVGKLEINANGSQERLSVWLDPTDVETGGEMISLENDVVTGLADFAGNLEIFIGDASGAGAGPIWWDDLAVGTTWEAVSALDVPRLTMEINSDTGAASLVNNTGLSQSFNFIQFASETDGLDVDAWNGLSEQSFDGGTWQANNPSASLITESNFTSSSVLNDGESLSLGNPFVLGGDEDVVVTVGNGIGLLNLAMVEYVTGGGINGDYNGSGQVEQADLDLVLLNWGTDGTTPPAGWVNDLPDGTIDQAELDGVLLNWGNQAGSLVGTNVPEPSTVVLAACLVGFAALGRFSRTRQVR